MGMFDSIKKGLGLSTGEFEILVQPDGCHVDGEINGKLTLNAHRDINIFSVNIELIHSYRDEYTGRQQEVFDGFTLAERISLTQNNSETWPFFFEIPPQVAPSLADFGWELRASASLQGGATLKKEQKVQVRLSPVMSAVVEVVRDQFGFIFEDAGADEDGVWMTYRPGSAIKGHFNSLEVAFDEQEDEVVLWIILEDFRPQVIERYRDAYDPRENSIELILDKNALVAGPKVDRQRVLELLRPLFSL